MKARTEQMLASKGLHDRELKRGLRRHPRHRVRGAAAAARARPPRSDRSAPATRSTRSSSSRAAATSPFPTTRASSTTAYVWLRTVEHRLQLVDEHQTHTTPDRRRARTHLARVLGFRDTPGAVGASTRSTRAPTRTRRIVRSIHEKLFFAPLLDTLAGVGAARRWTPPRNGSRRSASATSTQTRAALDELTAGPHPPLTRHAAAAARDARWLSAAPDPDLGLLQLRRLDRGLQPLVDAGPSVPRHAGRRRARRAASSVRQPRARRSRCTASPSSSTRSPTTPSSGGAERPRRAGRRRRSTRSTGARTTPTAGRAAPLQASPAAAHRRPRPARVRGPSTLPGASCRISPTRAWRRRCSSLEPDRAVRGDRPRPPRRRELSYASDIDVIFVYDGTTASRLRRAEQIATRLVRAIGETPRRRARRSASTPGSGPRASQGPLARSLGGYHAYFEQWAQTWEFQALTQGARRRRRRRGRRAASSRPSQQFVYRDPFPEEWRREVRRMKARIESERIPPGEDPQFHLKLGRGSLSDVEFTVQLEQLAHGGTHPERARPVDAPGARCAGRHRRHPRGRRRALRESFVLCERARNYRYLLTGSPATRCPSTATRPRSSRACSATRTARSRRSATTTAG